MPDMETRHPLFYDVWRDAVRIANDDADSDGAVACALLLASVIVGPDLTRCAALIEEPVERIEWMASNLERNGVWRGTMVRGDWGGPDGAVALLLDATCALGLLERTAQDAV